MIYFYGIIFFPFSGIAINVVGKTFFKKSFSEKNFVPSNGFLKAGGSFRRLPVSDKFFTVEHTVAHNQKI